MPAQAPVIDRDATTSDHVDDDSPWITLVLDDPVTTFGYVIGVLQHLFQMDRLTAERHTMEVHHDGKSAVFSGTLDEAEAACLKLLAAGLRSRFEQAGR
jgi:ATP-dependent Clp protease adaptor protein ClpS